jgi:hypothetical protein
MRVPAQNPAALAVKTSPFGEAARRDLAEPCIQKCFRPSGRIHHCWRRFAGLVQTEDELANALAHEIEDVELGQVSSHVAVLMRKKEIKNLQVGPNPGAHLDV